MSRTNWSKRGKAIADQLAKLDDAERIEAINSIRRAIHNVSPFRDEPVDFVEWVLAEIVQANSYNPNSVAPPEMRLLEHSIVSDGYTQPIVTHDTGITREVVDGFHRNRVGKESNTVRERVRGYLPVVTIRAVREAVDDRMASTIRHNRARGVHGVDKMTDIVSELAKKGWDDAKIGKELGMDPDEVLRFRQISGLSELFRDQEFSEAWELSEETA
jgi:ParB-like chromosome segregation protein Spo0J